jgi:hypothetical protein
VSCFLITIPGESGHIRALSPFTSGHHKHLEAAWGSHSRCPLLCNRTHPSLVLPCQSIHVMCGQPPSNSQRNVLSTFCPTWSFLWCCGDRQTYFSGNYALRATGYFLQASWKSNLVLITNMTFSGTENCFPTRDTDSASVWGECHKEHRVLATSHKRIHWQILFLLLQTHSIFCIPNREVTVHCKTGWGHKELCHL